MTTTEDRLSRLEVAYEHVATKADIADLRADLIRWMVGLMLGGAIATAAIISSAVGVLAD
jgi:hypothetical protein